MKRGQWLCVVVLILLISVPAAGASQATSQEQVVDKSLYERIGGYDVIAGIVDDFLPRIGNDEFLGRFIALSGSSRRRNRQLIVDLICKESGGPCFYNGRTMEASHQGLGITDNDWLMMMGLFEKTLDKFEIAGSERRDLIALIESFRTGIVEKEE